MSVKCRDIKTLFPIDSVYRRKLSISKNTVYFPNLNSNAWIKEKQIFWEHKLFNENNFIILNLQKKKKKKKKKKQTNKQKKNKKKNKKRNTVVITMIIISHIDQHYTEFLNHPIEIAKYMAYTLWYLSVVTVYKIKHFMPARRQFA